MCVNLVDLGETFQTHICLQKLASIQPRTSPVKFVRSSNAPLRACHEICTQVICYSETAHVQTVSLAALGVVAELSGRFWLSGRAAQLRKALRKAA